VVVTLGCLRVNEVARLQVCDQWFDYLMSYGVPGFEGTCFVRRPAAGAGCPKGADGDRTAELSDAYKETGNNKRF
jgi:hypothetical protein